MTAIPPGPFSPVHLIGGGGGAPFTTCKWAQGSQALVAKGLDVWYHSAYLRAVQVTYSDDSRSPVYGTSSDSHASILFAPGELVTTLTLWGNGVGTRTGRLRLTTSKGQTLDVGKDTSGQTAYDIDIGSGILVGMAGRSGSDVDQLGALFLRSAIAHVAITNIVYSPDLEGTNSGIQNVALDEAIYSNPAGSNKPLNWNFSGSTSRTQSTTFTETSGNTYGASVSVEVSGKVFGIGASATGGFEWEHQSSTSTATTTSSTADFAWGLSGTLDPGESCTCTAIVQRGEGRTNYTADVTIKLDDGTTNTFTERGVFQNIAYTQVRAEKQQIKGQVAELKKVLQPQVTKSEHLVV